MNFMVLCTADVLQQACIVPLQ